jgi:Uma2 family endonuclease
MTIQEYLSTPESVRPQELALGSLRVADAPSVPHQRVVGRLFLALNEHVSERHLGEVYLSPVDVILDMERHLVVQPDLVFLSEDRNRLVLDRIYGAPDLVIEVLSPRPRIGMLTEHLAWFARYGVRECWLVHIKDRYVEVLTFAGGRIAGRRVFDPLEPVRSRTLPGFNRSMAGIVGY